jgi:hypothetical protein
MGCNNSKFPRLTNFLLLFATPLASNLINVNTIPFSHLKINFLAFLVLALIKKVNKKYRIAITRSFHK